MRTLGWSGVTLGRRKGSKFSADLQEATEPSRGRCSPTRSGNDAFIVGHFRNGVGTWMRCSSGSMERRIISGVRSITKVRCLRGVVTLSPTERNLGTTANVGARDFRDLACWLIIQTGPISLNVTMPHEHFVQVPAPLPLRPAPFAGPFRLV
jgi:hypothetical protein